MSRRDSRLTTALLAAVLAALAALSLMIGRYRVSPADLWSVMTGGEAGDPNIWSVMVNIRIPRIILACLAGGSLASAGAAFQAVFRNPLGSPEILGSSRGAALGACLAILSGAGKAAVTAWAFAFSIIGVSLVLAAGSRVRGNHVMGMILCGMMAGSLFDAGVSWVKLAADPTSQLPAITFWLMGSLNSARTGDVLAAGIPMALGMTVLCAMRWRLNVLTMEDQEAAATGVNIRALRAGAVAAASLSVAACVAVCGVIGWVGLVVPHICRRLVGEDNRRLIPSSILAGAIFLLSADNISRTLFAAEIPIGILTALVGAPFFVWMISSGSKRGFPG